MGNNEHVGASGSAVGERQPQVADGPFRFGDRFAGPGERAVKVALVAGADVVGVDLGELIGRLSVARTADLG